MAHYIVRARMKPERRTELREKLTQGSFVNVRPFGRGLSEALKRAHQDPDTGEAVWEEQCFCTPPLAAEKPAILDRYFDDIVTEAVNEGAGWKRLADLPLLWSDR